MNQAESTAQLLERARAGDQAALDTLFARYVGPLSRWARGRLPGWARSLADTQDLVQDVLLQTFKHLRTFESRGEGALAAYLRQALMNRLRDEMRRVKRRAPGRAINWPDPAGGGRGRARGRTAPPRRARPVESNPGQPG